MGISRRYDSHSPSSPASILHTPSATPPTGTIPESIGRLAGLQTLDLSYTATWDGTKYVGGLSGTIVKMLIPNYGFSRKMMITNCDVILTPAPHTCTLYRFDSAGDRCPSGPNETRFGVDQSRRCVGFDPNQSGPRTPPTQ